MSQIRRNQKAKKWLKEYENLDVNKATKIELFDAIRKYRTIQMNVRCVLMRFNSSVTKAELIKKFNSSIRGAKRIIRE